MCRLSEDGLLDYTRLIPMYRKKNGLYSSSWHTLIAGDHSSLHSWQWHCTVTQRKINSLITLKDQVGKVKPSKVEAQNHSFEPSELKLALLCGKQTHKQNQHKTNKKYQVVYISLYKYIRIFSLWIFLLGSPQSAQLPVNEWQFNNFLVFSVRYTVLFTIKHPNTTHDYRFITILMGFAWSSLS